MEAEVEHARSRAVGMRIQSYLVQEGTKKLADTDRGSKTTAEIITTTNSSMLHIQQGATLGTHVVTALRVINPCRHNAIFVYISGDEPRGK